MGGHDAERGRTMAAAEDRRVSQGNVSGACWVLRQREGLEPYSLAPASPRRKGWEHRP